MVMEAIWLSIQEHGSNRRTTALCNNTSSEQSVLEDHCSSPATTPMDVSPSGGLACAIAAMAERQHLDGHSSNGSSSALGYGMPQSGGTPANETVPGNYPHESWIDVSSNSETETQREGGEWPMDQRSDAAEADGGYASLGSTMEAEHTLPLNGSMVDHIQPPIARPILPESFEEQMMLAMAVSLADARPRPSAQPLAWQSL